MPTYLTPGVYVEEVSMGTRPIAPVGTSTAALVGVGPDPNAHPNEPFACNSWSQFLKEFAPAGSAGTHLARAVFGFFMNGGARCYVVNVGQNNPIGGDARTRTGLWALDAIDEVAIVAAPGYTDAVSYDALLTHCERLADRVAILDAPLEVDNVDLLKQVATAGPPPAGDEGEGKKPARGAGAGRGIRPRNSDGGYGAFYFPWIVGRDPMNGAALERMPPSGHMAGIYARTDATRGVHKAPANEVVRGAVGLTYRVTRAEQGELNSAGVNCIRFFPDAGIRVWGARTVAEEASEWRYVNVRRLFNMVEESIARGTRWTVFEPNDFTLWQSVTRDVTAFLTLLWRDGALLGATPAEAFFVKCDAETNPPEVIDAGRLVIEIGIAPVKPAEFIVFRIGQWAGGSEVQTAA
jgi:phage tail sheath protein FI